MKEKLAPVFFSSTSTRAGAVQLLSALKSLSLQET